MVATTFPDLARRLDQNPLLRPSDIMSSSPDMTIECLLNPGVFRFNNKVWMLLRVAERPRQIEGQVSFPVYNDQGEIEILRFDKTDPDLDFTDPRIIRYKGKDYLTTLSHLRLVCSDDGKKFYEPVDYSPIFGRIVV
jgi:beta-1,2-mannobiose phosphorylase / 1,2-beta-oligomannan phosphorylase